MQWIIGVGIARHVTPEHIAASAGRANRRGFCHQLMHETKRMTARQRGNAPNFSVRQARFAPLFALFEYGQNARFRRLPINAPVAFRMPRPGKLIVKVSRDPPPGAASRAAALDVAVHTRHFIEDAEHVALIALRHRGQRGGICLGMGQPVTQRQQLDHREDAARLALVGDEGAESAETSWRKKRTQTMPPRSSMVGGSLPSTFFRMPCPACLGFES